MDSLNSLACKIADRIRSLERLDNRPLLIAIDGGSGFEAGVRLDGTYAIKQDYINRRLVEREDGKFLAKWHETWDEAEYG